MANPTQPHPQHLIHVLDQGAQRPTDLVVLTTTGQVYIDGSLVTGWPCIPYFMRWKGPRDILAGQR